MKYLMLLLFLSSCATPQSVRDTEQAWWTFGCIWGDYPDVSECNKSPNPNICKNEWDNHFKKCLLGFENFRKELINE